MGKYGYAILLSVIFLLVGFFLAHLYIKSTNPCYNLPSDSDPEKFGPQYWKCLHGTVSKIPCPACQGEAVEMMSFFHDAVNWRLKKPIYNENNFKKWLNKICDIKSEYNA